MTIVRRDVKFDEEKSMQLSLERELELRADEELLVPKDEPRDVEHPQEEEHGAVETAHVEPSTEMVGSAPERLID